ncbi:MAG: MBL fold metallo-hydrolase, partial [Sulfurimonadaceae bacterium]|nr:MBL fold metallo-hydrolase [Sulfurimonadaceae bacterium]
NAEHIMGSAFVMLDFIEDAASKRIVFSGDLGSPHRLIIDSADTIDEADALFIESTYGDRDHKPIVQSVAEFKKAVIETLERDGNVLIPSFALERSQEVLWLLHEMFEEQELPKCRVFLDSPLAIKATELYNKYPIHLSDEVELQAFGGQNPFSFPWLEHTVDRGDSMKINNVEERAIIIAGSGMCNGGRIMHHLKNRLWNPNNAVVFVGFQVGGTLGRRIVDGDQYVKIYGEEILVRAKIYTINGFSAHGDQDDLIDWMKSIDGLEHIGLIHGETESMKRFAQAIKEKLGRDAEIVEYGIGIEV